MQNVNKSRRAMLKYSAGSIGAGLGLGLSNAMLRPAVTLLAATSITPVQQALAQQSADAFSADVVTDAARAIARKPYKPDISPLPQSVAAMRPDEQAAIRIKREHLVWGNDNLGFVVEPIHRTRQTPGQISLFLVDRSMVRPLAFNPDHFNYPGNLPKGLMPEAGLAGFRILQRDEKRVLSHIAHFIAPDIFQSVGRNQTFGLAARPLSIRTADGKAEEQVAIRALWIEKPAPADKTLTVHAFFDSRPMAGTLRFTIRPGTATIVDTECTLFARATVKEFGLAVMAATHYSGMLDTRNRDDVRPIIQEASGLQIHSGANEWLWRPVSNPQRLQISAFVDNNPRGFGLLQRDRRFDTYMDDASRWERRPTLWIEPIGKWGEGEITLQEIPSGSPNNKNILSYWRPREGMATGSEKRFVFRQFWTWTPPDVPELALVTATRQGKIRADAPARSRRYLVQFAGDDLFPENQTRDIQAKVTASHGAVNNVRVFPSPESKTVQVLFDLEAGNETIAELRLHLEAAQKRISEVWLYRWTA